MPERASDQPIASLQNPTLRRLRRLAQSREPGRVLLEGRRLVQDAVEAGVNLELLVLREGTAFPCPAERTISVAPKLFRALSQTVTPQGVLAIARQPMASPQEAITRARAGSWPLLVLDRIQDPGNVGAILRTAAAAGAPAAAILPGTADPFGAKAVRASAGAVFRIAVASATWADLAELGGWGAAAHGGLPLAQANVEKEEMLVLGSEAHGLSRQDLRLVTVPVHSVESLNVAAAAAVLLFEIQRRKAA